jgi:hypothetical protein
MLGAIWDLSQYYLVFPSQSCKTGVKGLERGISF